MIIATPSTASMKFRNRQLFSMSAVVVLLILAVAPSVLQAQGVLDWAKARGGSNDDKAYSMVQTSDEGFVIAGKTMSNNGDVSGLKSGNGSGDADIWVAKVDKSGAMVWQRVYGGTGDDVANCIIQTSDGGFAIAGTTGSSDDDVSKPGEFHGGTEDAWILKLNSDGTLNWQQCYGGTQSDGARSIVQTSDSGFVFAGYTASNDGDLAAHPTNGGYDSWVARIDKNGLLKWSFAYGGSDQDEANSVCKTYDGGFAVAGYTISSDNGIGLHGGSGAPDFLVFKVGSDGNMVGHFKTFGGSDDDEASQIIETSDSGFALAGFTGSNDYDVSRFVGGAADFWVLKLDQYFSLEWENSYGGTDDDEAASIIQTKDTGFAIVGKTNSNDSDVTNLNNAASSVLYSDAWIVKVSSKGALQWQKTIGGSKDDEAYCIIPTVDIGYAIAGETGSNDSDLSASPSNGKLDAMIVRLHTDSTVIKAGVSQPVTSMVTSPAIYPNPTSGLGRLEYSIRNASPVRIEVYNQIGQRLSILKDGVENPGTHTQSFDLTGMPSGQYFFHFQVGADSKVGALELLR